MTDCTIVLFVLVRLHDFRCTDTDIVHVANVAERQARGEGRRRWGGQVESSSDKVIERRFGAGGRLVQKGHGARPEALQVARETIEQLDRIQEALPVFFQLLARLQIRVHTSIDVNQIRPDRINNRKSDQSIKDRTGVKKVQCIRCWCPSCRSRCSCGGSRAKIWSPRQWGTRAHTLRPLWPPPATRAERSARPPPRSYRRRAPAWTWRDAPSAAASATNRSAREPSSAPIPTIRWEQQCRPFCRRSSYSWMQRQPQYINHLVQYLSVHTMQRNSKWKTSSQIN